MNSKDAIVGTAKQIIAEIVGDGKLAQEGARQSAREIGSEAGAEHPDLAQRSAALSNAPQPLETGQMNENRFASWLGHAALKVWADLPRDAQERLFAAAVDDGVMANSLAEFLHDRHPRTAHPPKPTRLA